MAPTRNATLSWCIIRSGAMTRRRCAHIDEHLLGIVGIDSARYVAVQDRHRRAPNGADARLARSPARHAGAEPIREARKRRGRLAAGDSTDAGPPPPSSPFRRFGRSTA